jgi:hypothetical protein
MWEFVSSLKFVVVVVVAVVFVVFVSHIQVCNCLMGWGGMHWIYLAQDRDHCKGILYIVMNFRLPQIVGEFLSS